MFDSCWVGYMQNGSKSVLEAKYHILVGHLDPNQATFLFIEVIIEVVLVYTWLISPFAVLKHSNFPSRQNNLNWSYLAKAFIIYYYQFFIGSLNAFLNG